MGYFSDDAMLRQVHRETVVALSGPRALLMQATHPVAFAGFFANTTSLSEPYERLARTARVMDTIAYGTKAGADRATRHVRAMHARVRGVTPERAGRFPAGGARSGDPDRHAPARAAPGAAAARAGQPDHRRVAAARSAPPVWAALGSGAGGRAPRRRGVPQSPGRDAAARPRAAHPAR